MFPAVAQAQSADFTVSATREIRDTGFLQHLLPRFSLKHGVRITQVDEGGDVVIGGKGVPVFAGLDKIWSVTGSKAAGPDLFMEWLLSEIGKRTIESFKLDSVAVFTAQVKDQKVAPVLAFEGDLVQGEALSLAHCGRCHVINETNRMKGMGQTPSFALMRTFDDWDNRFATFFVLNPHPSFTQIAGITESFAAHLPPAIVPLEITQAEIDHILSYVATITPADLGAPLQSQ
jgi:mono/diheme cytochrome c family protein|tara:strand:+ start:972 stop:1667 length:696 start_codon:yes stop_codon:yes gene_type:complete